MEHRPLVSAPASIAPIDPRRQMGLADRLLSSNRFVLGMAILLAVFLPGLLRHTVLHGSYAQHFKFDRTLFIAIAPIIAGHFSLQRMGLLPLVSARTLIFPTFLTAFGAALLASYILQIPAGPIQLLVPLTICLCWYLVVSIVRGRLQRPIIGLLGVCPTSFGALSGNVKWQPVTPSSVPQDVAAVVVDPHAELNLEHSHLITRLVLEGLPVYHRSHFEEGLTGRVRFSSHADNNFGALLPSLTYLRLKRIFDLAAAVILAPFLLPVVFVAAVLVKLDSPGPAFFRQSRKGFRGQAFDCFKLRTMRVGEAGPAFTLERDPRITRIGQFLRKSRIDELPQIINIVKGEMSWIGPRPEAVELATHYAAHLPFYDYRHAVRPGISGWAAVHQGNVAEVDAAREKLSYDFFYIKYFSFWLDLLIVLKTFTTVLTGVGSR